MLNVTHIHGLDELIAKLQDTPLSSINNVSGGPRKASVQGKALYKLATSHVSREGMAERNGDWNLENKMKKKDIQNRSSHVS